MNRDLTYRIVGWTLAIAFSAACWLLVIRNVAGVFS